MKRRRGFTIVELLIVIVVIAILAAIVATTVSSMRDRSNNLARTEAARKTLNLLRASLRTNGSATFKAIFSSSRDFCAGTNFEDLEPSVANNQCFKFHGSTPAYFSSSQQLNDFLGLSGSTSISFPQYTYTNSGGNTRTRSAPTIYYFNSTGVTTDGVDGKLGMINYELAGVNQDCLLRPNVSYSNTSNGKDNYVTNNNMNAGSGQGVTFCQIYYDRDALAS